MLVWPAYKAVGKGGCFTGSASGSAMEFIRVFTLCPEQILIWVWCPVGCLPWAPGPLLLLPFAVRIADQFTWKPEPLLALCLGTY